MMLSLFYFFLFLNKEIKVNWLKKKNQNRPDILPSFILEIKSEKKNPTSQFVPAIPNLTPVSRRV